MTKKINTKAFCEAWNDAIETKENPWNKVYNKYLKSIPSFRGSATADSFIMFLKTNYEPPKRIKHDSDIKRS